MAKKQRHSLAIEAAKAVENRYSGAWRFFDDCIRRALIADAVVSWVTLSERCSENAFAGESAKQLAANLGEWCDQTAEILATEHGMPMLAEPK